MCEWGGCDAAGSHPAPKGRGREGQYHHFCIDHVRLYNKSYDYFSGMPDSAVAAWQKDAVTGHRPTWTMGVNPDTEAVRARPAEDFEMPHDWTRRSGDPRVVFGRMRGRVQGGPRTEPVRKAKPLEKRALTALDLDERASPEEIRARYKELVKRHHPDANGGDRSSEALLQEIIQAYKLLRQAGVC
nr:J domain-containing protein [Siculibacillus lacustris]